MATATIEHTCGHTEVHQILRSEKKWRPGQLESRICSNCWRVEQSAEAAKANAAAGLPSLTGSPKQIAWAETIRQKRMPIVVVLHREEWHKYLRNEKEAKVCTNLYAQLRLLIEPFKEKIRLETRARWWIDHRFGGCFSDEFRHSPEANPIVEKLEQIKQFVLSRQAKKDEQGRIDREKTEPYVKAAELAEKFLAARSKHFQGLYPEKNGLSKRKGEKMADEGQSEMRAIEQEFREMKPDENLIQYVAKKSGIIFVHSPPDSDLVVCLIFSQPQVSAIGRGTGFASGLLAAASRIALVEKRTKCNASIKWGSARTC